MAAKEALLAQQTEHAGRLAEQQAVHECERAAALVSCVTTAGAVPARVVISGVGAPVGGGEENDTDGAVGGSLEGGGGEPPAVEKAGEVGV